jgi:hypothetical protein
VTQHFDLAMYNNTPFDIVYHELRHHLLDLAPSVDVGEWHAMNTSGNPALVSRELRGVTFHTLMGRDMDDAVRRFRPNLPWAEDQFQERVSGKPLNPGETYKHWPWQSKMDDHTKEQGQFSHTYMERYWPKYAGFYPYDDSGADRPVHHGIRYRYGDLDDVVAMLARSPLTRQAVLPVWFPEDTGGTSNQRLPCSLTYQFILRNGLLHCEYSIRSCDFVRHFRDDVYMTARLVQHVIHKVSEWYVVNDAIVHPAWRGRGGNVGAHNTPPPRPGTLSMHIGSLHIMEGDVGKLQRERKEEEDARHEKLISALG